MQCVLLQKQSAPEKLKNKDSINTKVFEEEGVEFGEGVGKRGGAPPFFRKFPLPLPNTILSHPH